jgi:3-phenylpropionate/trans-cinnamate dioxygenase ferredoxin subunit
MAAQLAAQLGDLAPGSAKRIELVDATGQVVRVALVRAEDGSWHAIGDECSHGQVSLAEGDVEGCRLECWLHGSQFDLVTGEPMQLPATKPVPIYPVTFDGEQVLVDVDVKEH